MAATSNTRRTLALVHEGWNHLMSQRPLAAWGTWQRTFGSIRTRPRPDRRLRRSKRRLKLPLAARKIYRFRKPATEAQRARWDRVLHNGEAAEIDECR